MPEDYYATPVQPPLRRGTSLRLISLIVALSFLGGAALIGYLVWNGQIPVTASTTAPQQVAAAPMVTSAAPTPAASLATSELDLQVGALERRIAQLNLQAAAFGGNSARAEGLLVALAVRRAIERGSSLGYLEDQLRTRFGAARPDAVNTLVVAAKTPVTLDVLAAQLDDLGPALLGRPVEEAGWTRLRRELGSLFVIRRETGRTQLPAQRLDHARLLLRSGKISEAMAEVSRMPGSAAAKDWLVVAQRYADAQAALDQIEQAALTEPERLKSGDGETVNQPGLSASPLPPS